MADRKNTGWQTVAEHIFLNNPVLAGGLVIGQLAAGCVSLQCGAALSITFAFVSLPVLVFAAAIGRYLPKAMRIVSYMVISALMLLPSYFTVRSIAANITDSVGIYMTLMAVTTIPVAYSAKYSERHSVGNAFLDGVGLTLGFALAAAVIGGVREFLGSGTLWGNKITSAMFPSLLLPFWGFILMGFMAAFVRAVRDLFSDGRREGFAVREEDENG